MNIDNKISSSFPPVFTVFIMQVSLENISYTVGSSDLRNWNFNLYVTYCVVYPVISHDSFKIGVIPFVHPYIQDISQNARYVDEFEINFSLSLFTFKKRKDFHMLLSFVFL